MPVRKWELRISDILDALDKIRMYTEGMDFESFCSDLKTVDAVLRNITTIGEAANHVPEDIIASSPEIPWRDMRDIRNILVHEYFGINKRIIWETIQYDLPPLVPLLNALITKK
jgi:uncharacterized protein with HEPN domain